MEELAIKKKAKRYDEALEKARSIRFGNPQSGTANTVCEEIFPELKESEDEKIRKALVDALNKNLGNGIEKYGTTFNAALAWLEKQKAVDVLDKEEREFADNVDSYRKDMDEFYKKGYNAGREAEKQYWLEKQEISYTKKDVDDAYLEGMVCAKNELEKQGKPSIKWNKNTEGNKPQVNHSVLMKTTHGIAEGEWQGEQWFQYRWAGIVRDSDVLSWMELSDLEKQGKQKPADKVEPKFKVKYAGSEYNVLETKNIAGVTFYGIEDEPNHIDYVKADNCEIISVYGIKESGLSFPTKPVMFSGKKPKRMISAEAKEAMYDKPAWSEEDENILKSIHNSIDVECLLKNGVEYLGMVYWLKSLKDRVQPQNTWKPSDEQMKVLDSVIDEYDGYPEFDSLVSLKNDLRKL